MKVKDLVKFAQNPRRISASQQRILFKGLAKYGDLSGVTWNVLEKELVGGNQRSEGFNQEDEIVYTEKFKKPDDQGTVALGYILHNGKKYFYREVAFSREDHLAASLLANKGGGEWDWAKVKELTVELDTGGFDMENTGFDVMELENMTASHWDVGTSSVDKTEENLDGITAVIKVKCPQEIKDEVLIILKRAFLETSLEGVEIV